FHFAPSGIGIQDTCTLGLSHPSYALRFTESMLGGEPVPLPPSLSL
ncbi:hypothetical protein AVEN_187328-1, partial [Araneus ventricosus]